MPTDLELLIEAARLHPFTPSEREEQRKSFAYGNTKIENPLVTWEMVDREADRLTRERQESIAGR